MDCVFADSHVENQGGGFYSENGSPIIRECTFIGNSAAAGAGFFCWGGEPLLIGCTFLENSARGFGGGLGTEAGSAPEIRGCRFTGNEAGDGGGACVSASDALISRCDFMENSADFGGGLSLVSAGSVTIDRTVMAGNTATTFGGGVHILYSGVDILRSTVAFNGCPGSGGGVYGFESDVIANTVAVTHNDGIGVVVDGGMLSLSYSDIFGNQGGEFSGDLPAGMGILTGVNTNGDSTDMLSNIFQDPVYLGNDIFNLLPHGSSPLIDAGDPALPSDPDGSVGDIGAFPYASPLVLDVSIMGGSLYLQWTGNDQASAYLVYGMNNSFHFNPSDGLLLEELSEGATTWSTDMGFDDPENQWMFRIVAIDGYEREITRSSGGGEFDQSWDLP